MQQEYYPYIFNTDNNLYYIGSHPEPKYYSEDSVMNKLNFLPGMRDKMQNC